MEKALFYTNDQDIFDRVVTHLFTQKKQSKEPARGSTPCCCRYRYKSDDGTVLKCAIGCLIPDSEYKEGFEGTFSMLTGRWKDYHIFLGRNYLLLDELQATHDYDVNWRSNAIMQNTLKLIASKYGLNTNILESLHLY